MRDQLIVRWEGEESEEQQLATVSINKKSTLEDVYDSVLVQRPELLNVLFSFLHNSIPIRSELWSIIKACRLPGILEMRPGVFDFIRRVDSPISHTITCSFDPQSEEYCLPESQRNYLLKLEEGQSVSVIHQGHDSEWYFGMAENTRGWFPRACLAASE